MTSTEEIIKKLGISNHTEWNKWRHENNYPEIDLTDRKFNGKDFSSFNFHKLNLKNVQFINCELSFLIISNSFLENVLIQNSSIDKCSFTRIEAYSLNLKDSKAISVNFTHSKFTKCEFFTNEITELNFKNSEFINIDLSHKKATKISFSGIKIDFQTRAYAKKNPNITIGLNGIYNRTNNSASLQNEKPKGDEMLGGDEEVILASLKKSKLSFSTSLSATLIAFTLKFVGVNSFAYVGLKINPDTFAFLALPIIFFSLYKSNVILNDVIQSMKYIQTQKGATKIGRFPWLISRFWGIDLKQKIESFFIRIVYCLHPLLLLPLMAKWVTILDMQNIIYGLSIPENLCELYSKNAFYFIITLWILFGLTIYLSIKLFIKSQQMQKPILFDIQNPTPSETDSYRIAKSLEEIKKTISEFFGIEGIFPTDRWNLRDYLRNIKSISENELEEIKKKKKDESGT